MDIPTTAWPELEITTIPELGPSEISLLERHSLLNILNVIRGELHHISMVAAKQTFGLLAGDSACTRLIELLPDPVASLAASQDIESYIKVIQDDIARCLAETPESRKLPSIVESLQNIESVFAVLRVRSRELLARARQPAVWDLFTLTQLEQDLRSFFDALALNSHNRYRVVYDEALQGSGDYYVSLKFSVADNSTFLWLPPLLVDVMRDLLANARKYTEPGGRLTASLVSDASNISFRVRDNGKGIPVDELPHVTTFGYRATNVMQVPTNGGGFGLTKAFFVTKQLGGRFWVASQEGVGTEVRLEVPILNGIGNAG